MKLHYSHDIRTQDTQPRPWRRCLLKVIMLEDIVARAREAMEPTVLSSTFLFRLNLRGYKLSLEPYVSTWIWIMVLMLSLLALGGCSQTTASQLQGRSYDDFAQGSSSNHFALDYEVLLSCMELNRNLGSHLCPSWHWYRYYVYHFT